MADELDEVFGPIRDADRTDEWELGKSPVSLCELSSEVGGDMKTALSLAARPPFGNALQSIKLIWAVDQFGKMHVAVEEVAKILNEAVRPGFPVRRGIGSAASSDKKLGHPCVAPNGKARIAGEIYIDESTEHPGQLIWTLNTRSGRFHGALERRPTYEQIRNAAKIFAKEIGEPISLDRIDDMTGVASMVEMKS